MLQQHNFSQVATSKIFVYIPVLSHSRSTTPTLLLAVTNDGSSFSGPLFDGRRPEFMNKTVSSVVELPSRGHVIVVSQVQHFCD